jgi:hypothetical protein
MAWPREQRLEPWLTRWVDQRRDRAVAEATEAPVATSTPHRRRHAAATDAKAEELLAAMAALLGDRDRVLAATRR